MKKMMKQFPMSEILGEIQILTLALPDFFPTIPEAQQAEYSAQWVAEQLEVAFDKTCVHAETIGKAAAYFHTAWSVYKKANYDNYCRLIAAEYDEYSLVYNYDKHVEGTETTSYGDSDTPAEQRTYQHGETVTRTDGQYKETNSVATYNAQSKETNTTQRGHMAGQNDTIGHTGTDTDTVRKGDTVRKPQLHEYGNIGVQTTADIILKEITLRTTALCYEYLAAFVRTYMNTYYPDWGGEGCF